ncbi:hypothetical protein ACFLQU_06185, partial [Verrucomicrobiota bacterium]
ISTFASAPSRTTAADLTGKTPQEVYAIYEKAIVDYDIDTYFDCLSMGQQETPKETHQQLMMAKRLGVTTQNIKVEDCQVDGETARLKLKGDQGIGALEMIKEAGVWKISGAEKWGEAAQEDVASVVESHATAGLQPPGAEDPQVKRLAWKVLEECDKALTEVAKVKRCMSEGSIAKAKVESAYSPALARANANDLTEQLGAAREAKKLAVEALKEAEATLEKVEDMRKEIERQREEARRAEEAAAAATLAEEQRVLKEQQHKELAKKEMGMAEAAHAESLILLKQHSYKEAVDALEGQLKGYETEEGKEVMGILIERCTRLQGLKDFVIERLNASPYRWGWGLNSATAMDVIGADNLGVKLKGKTVDWSQVSSLQMLKFVDRYLKPPESKKLSLKVLAGQNMAAAIFCYENKRPAKRAGYAQKTAELFPRYGEDLRRLIPQ